MSNSTKEKQRENNGGVVSAFIALIKKLLKK